jgi:hypothetical protein
MHSSVILYNSILKLHNRLSSSLSNRLTLSSLCICPQKYSQIVFKIYYIPTTGFVLSFNRNISVNSFVFLKFDEDDDHVDGWDHVCKLRLPTPYCSSPRWYMNMEKHAGMMMSTAENSWLVHQSSLAILAAEPSGSKQEEWEKVIRIYFLLSISVHTWKWVFTLRKILRRWVSGFTSAPKKGVLRIFVVLKNPSPGPDLNPWTLGRMACKLTTRPPRRLPYTSSHTL